VWRLSELLCTYYLLTYFVCVCCQVVVAALKFFLGSDSDENDESDSDSETEVIKITAK